MDLTIVTGFYDLEKRDKTGRRSAEDYIKHGKFVCDLKYPMVIFCDPEYEKVILDYRKNIPCYTKTIPLPLEDFEHYKLYYEKIKNNITSNSFHRANPIKNTPNYISLIIGKFYMLNMVINSEEIEKTSKICWLDFGIRHVVKRDNYQLAFENITDKVKLIICRNIHSNCIDENSHNNFWVFCMAGYFSGSVENMKIFADEVKEVFLNKLNKGIVLTEEQAMTITTYKNTSNYEWSYGDFVNILENYNILQECSHVVKVLNWAINSNDDENIYRICKLMYKNYKNGNFTIDDNTFKFVMTQYKMVLQKYGKVDELESLNDI